MNLANNGDTLTLKLKAELRECFKGHQNNKVSSCWDPEYTCCFYLFIFLFISLFLNMLMRDKRTKSGNHITLVLPKCKRCCLMGVFTCKYLSTDHQTSQKGFSSHLWTRCKQVYVQIWKLQMKSVSVNTLRFGKPFHVKSIVTLK